MSNLSLSESSLSPKRVNDFLKQNAIFVCLVVLVMFIAVKDPRFLSLTCFRDILMQVSTRVILALGAAFVLLTAGCDLSTGRIVGLTAVISASLLQTADYPRRFFPNLPQLPIWLPILIAIAAGLFIGLVNGFVISRFSVPPFIATMAAQVIVYGATSIYFNMPPNDSQPIAGFRPDFTYLGSGTILHIPVIVLIALAVVVITWVILYNTRFGKNIYAVGGNLNAAKVSGVNVNRTLLGVYAYAGALYAIGGILEAARTGGATNNYGLGYEFDAIAACVVGGVSLMGGIGTIPGILAGVLIFGVINYGLTFIGINPYWQQIIKGLIIVVAVAFDIRKYIAKK